MIELIKKIKSEVKASERRHDNFQTEMKKIRIKDEYTKAKKKLHHDPKLNFWQMVQGSGGIKYIKGDLKTYGQDKFRVPKNLQDYLKYSDFTGYRFDFFGKGVKNFGVNDNEAIRELIKSDIFPSFMLRFLVLDSYDGGDIGTWLYSGEVEDSEILFLDYEEQTIQIVSNSMKNFTQRALKCYHEDVEQDYFEPSDKALTIIREIDGDNVLPDSYVYSLSFTEDWPEHWQEIASDI